MAEWLHSECQQMFDSGDVTPTTCPDTNIPVCPNPTEGFTVRCANVDPGVWKCEACGWIMRSSTQPDYCPAGRTTHNCTKPTEGTFTEICK